VFYAGSFVIVFPLRFFLRILHIPLRPFIFCLFHAEMAKTQQTARRSTGGKAPRSGLATRYARQSYVSPEETAAVVAAVAEAAQAAAALAKRRAKRSETTATFIPREEQSINSDNTLRNPNQHPKAAETSKDDAAPPRVLRSRNNCQG
jgi:hypothetical protein